MKWKNLLKVAFQSILKNGMRSLLTMLGIVIGVGAVIVMVAVGEGSQAKIEGQISKLGTNLIMVRSGASRAGGVSRGAGSMNSLTLDDVETLAAEATLLSGVSPEVQASAQVIGGGNNWSTKITGVTPEYMEIRAWEMESGAFFTDREVKISAKVAVLGKDVVDALFPDQDPVGQQIRIRNTPFKVIGVLKEKGDSMMGSEDDLILAPSTTVLHRLSGSQYIRMIVASAITEEQMTAAQEEITEILRRVHRLRVGDDDDFSMRTQTEITDMATGITETLTLLLGAIAAVSLVVGGIGIMNIMLVSVTERTREIGLRLAIGARGRDVLTQFLVEALVLSLTGGLIGILIAVGIASLLTQLFGLNTVIDPSIVLFACAFSGAIGVFFGFYPARKAAALNPIDALRYE
ncbi:MAG: FtsX-like permease family protein [Gemmatimonadetes bacterium]|nr:FtsX-like permease family protein [Gemmatimonadota bacterium]